MPYAQIVDTVLWLVAVEAIGLAAFPLAYYLFPRLKDRGYSVSKPLGILIIGYAAWVLSVLHILPSIWLTVMALFLVMAAFSGKMFWDRRREISEFIVRERTAILIGEAVFLAVFAGWVLYRAYDPAIDHTEQPMDFAFLNASIRSSLGPPEDPWLRGESVSYYYFGYWMMGTLTKLTGIPSFISYNLSMALVPALGAMGIFGLVYNMVRAEARRLRYALVGGVAAAVLLVGGANLEGAFEFARANEMGSEGFWNWAAIKLNPTDPSSGYMSALDETSLNQSWHPAEHWWWFRATRVVDTFDGSQWIDTTIQEFPFFSFVLGDLHPHVMSIPFVLLFLTACWSYLRSPPLSWTKHRFRTVATVMALALALGGLAFTNMWDLPVFSAVFIGIAVVKAYAARESGLAQQVRATVPVVVAVIGGALVLILPYLLTFTSQVSAVAPIAPVVAATTRPLHLFIVWGLFLVAVTPFILSEFWQTTVDDDWVRLLLLALAIGFFPYLVWAFLQGGSGGTSGDMFGRLLHVLPFALLISVAVYTALWLVKNGNVARGRVFALALSALGLLLMMGPDLLYVDDGFGGPSERMNTVFKLYYQGWIVFAAASGFAIYYWSTLRERLTGIKRLMTAVWSVVFVALLAASAYYPIAAATSKGGLFHGGATLDGLAFLNPVSGAEYRAIKFVRENASVDSALLEAVGRDYSPFGRISGSTGVPTILGWAGHELQWRGSLFEGRREDVERIYQTQDVDEAKTLLARYGVDYVYVGRRERDLYGEQGLGKFSSFMDTVFSEGGVVIYRAVR